MNTKKPGGAHLAAKGKKARRQEEDGKKQLRCGAILLAAFLLWTVLIKTVDVRPVGVNGSEIGLAAVNVWFHRVTGVHMGIYKVTAWLGMIPFAVCLAFGCLGLWQLLRRRKLTEVDPDILLLGVYYVAVILFYAFFELKPMNYRPILIEGAMEASYPSSTTLLVLSVMPTLIFQVNRRIGQPKLRQLTALVVLVFSAFMVLGRLISGVHWLTDIIGGVLLSAGLYLLYRGSVFLADAR